MLLALKAQARLGLIKDVREDFSRTLPLYLVVGNDLRAICISDLPPETTATVRPMTSIPISQPARSSSTQGHPSTPKAPTYIATTSKASQPQKPTPSPTPAVEVREPSKEEIEKYRTVFSRST